MANLWACGRAYPNYSLAFGTPFFNGVFVSGAVIRETMKQPAFTETRCGLLRSDGEREVGGKHAPKKQFLSSSYLFFFWKEPRPPVRKVFSFYVPVFSWVQKKLLMRAGQITETTLEQNWGRVWISEYCFSETAGNTHLPFLWAETVCHAQPGP